MKFLTIILVILIISAVGWTRKGYVSDLEPQLYNKQYYWPAPVSIHMKDTDIIQVMVKQKGERFFKPVDFVVCYSTPTVIIVADTKAEMDSAIYIINGK